MSVLMPPPPAAVVGQGGYFAQLDEYAKQFGTKGYLVGYSRSQDRVVYLPVMRLDFRLTTHRPGKWCEVQDIPGLLPYRDLICGPFLPHQLLTDGLQTNTPIGSWTPERDPDLETFDAVGEVD